ncbi:FHA domain-containing protein [Hyalangium versicolor]|uniref:FHA domain-containing protein n=1 Tax=Hyalangium versicolor TaxID=2861190 RepID=UPI001CCFA0E4|nr:FHA domain-containing protein [Hyalangium versicolor]
MASQLTEAFFCNQIGPFVLVQKPPRPVVEQMAMRMGAQSTLLATGPSLEAMQLAVMLRFDELLVASLPPLRSTDVLTVGRLPSCDLVINDPSVSKEHARLCWHGKADSCTVVDLASMNGTQINGHPLAPHKEFFVQDGDLVRFGDADFAYMTAESLWGRLRR